MSNDRRLKTRARNLAGSLLLLLLSLAVSAGFGEAILRFKNASMTNYDIEMWRYANELKMRVADPDIDFDHRRNATALLQNVELRTNEWGLRGGAVPLQPEGGRRILFLGGSITLGWGVKEEDTVEARLQRALTEAGEDVQVLNGGVGNYNAERYVSRFFSDLTGLHPTDIVVQYFLRDAETLPPAGGSFVLRHSELAVTLWIAYHRLFDHSGETALVDHYRDAYRSDAAGFLRMKEMLRRLADYARSQNIRLYLAMTPDVHNLVDYPFGFVHQIMRQVADDDGYRFIDLLPGLQGRSPSDLWAMPGDPHPNALGHQLMAETIFPVLHQTGSRAAQ